MPGANHYTQEVEAIDRLAALTCSSCTGTRKGEGKESCPECLDRVGMSTGRRFRGLMMRCQSKHYESEESGWLCQGQVSCEGVLMLPATPAVALNYLMRHEHMVSVKHTTSGFYQVQWREFHGTGETPLLAIDAAIMAGLKAGLRS